MARPKSNDVRIEAKVGRQIDEGDRLPTGFKSKEAFLEELRSLSMDEADFVPCERRLIIREEDAKYIYIFTDAKEPWASKANKFAYIKPLYFLSQNTPVWGVKQNKKTGTITMACSGQLFGPDKDNKTYSKCPSKNVFVNGRCSVHGGKHAIGANTYRLGRYKRMMNTRGISLQEILQDPSLKNLDIELGLLDARQENALRVLEEVDIDTTSWYKVKDYAEEVRVLLSLGNITEENEKPLIKALNKLLLHIDRGANEKRAWAEVNGAIQDRAKILKINSEIQKASMNTFTVDEVAALFTKSMQAIAKRVSDLEVRSLIAGDIKAIMGTDIQQAVPQNSNNNTQHEHYIDAVFEIDK